MKYQYVISRVDQLGVDPLPWYQFSDIGKRFNGRVLELAEFEQVEREYFEAILSFVELTSVSTFRVVAPEVSDDFAAQYPELAKRDTVDVDTAMFLIQACVRQEGFWCVLVSSGLVIRPGSGMQAYIGTSLDAARIKGQVSENLFVYEEYDFIFEIPEITPYREVDKG